MGCSRGRGGKGGQQEEEEEWRRWTKTKQVPWDGVEKCDLVPRPGDIFSTLLIDF